MTPWDFAMLTLGFILGGGLGLVIHIRWLQRQARINAEIDRRYQKEAAAYLMNQEKMKT